MAQKSSFIICSYSVDFKKINNTISTGEFTKVSCHLPSWGFGRLSKGYSLHCRVGGVESAKRFLTKRCELMTVPALTAIPLQTLNYFITIIIDSLSSQHHRHFQPRISLFFQKFRIFITFHRRGIICRGHQTASMEKCLSVKQFCRISYVCNT